MARLNQVTVNTPLGISFRMVRARLASSREQAHGRVRRVKLNALVFGRAMSCATSAVAAGVNPPPETFYPHPSPVRVSRNSARPRRPHAHRQPTTRPHAPIWTAGGSISCTRGNLSQRRDKDGGHGGRTPRPERTTLLATAPVSSRRPRLRDSGRERHRDSSAKIRARTQEQSEALMRRRSVLAIPGRIWRHAAHEQSERAGP